MKTYFDKRACDDPLEVGEQVLVLLPEDSSGAFAQWHGPFTILDKPSTLTYVISTPSRGRKARHFHRNLLNRFTSAVEILPITMVSEEDGPEQLELAMLEHTHETTRVP